MQRKNLNILLITLTLLISKSLSIFPRCPPGCKTCGEPENRILPEEKEKPKKEEKPKENPKNDKNEKPKEKPKEKNPKENKEEKVVCRTCKDTFHLVENKCEECEISNCDICDKTLKKCERCSKHFFKKFNEKKKEEQCVSCPENCVYCESKTTCKVCILGYTFSEKTEECVVNRIYFAAVLFSGVMLLFCVVFCLMKVFCRKKNGEKKVKFDKKNDEKNEKSEKKEKKLKVLSDKKIIKSEKKIKVKEEDDEIKKAKTMGVKTDKELKTLDEIKDKKSKNKKKKTKKKKTLKSHKEIPKPGDVLISVENR